MKLSQVEHERSGLIQFLVILIMAFLAAIMFLSYRQGQGIGIPSLVILSLIACLYAVVRERRLSRLQSQLVKKLVDSQSRVVELGETLEAEHAGLVEAQDRSERLDTRLHEVASLYRAISAVNAVGDSRAIPDTVLAAALQLVDGETGSVMLVDEARKNLAIVSSKGLGEGVAEMTRQKIGDGVAGWVAEKGEPLLLTGDVHGDARFRNQVDKRTVRISMSVPLSLRGQVVGVLNIGSSSEEGKEKFAEGRLRVATIFGQHASVAIRNAQLTTTLRQHGLLPDAAN